LEATKIAAGVVLWPSGKIAHRMVIPTQPARGGKAVLKDTLAVAVALVDWAKSHAIEVAGIGAGVAELVNNDGNVTSDQTIRVSLGEGWGFCRFRRLQMSLSPQETPWVLTLRMPCPAQPPSGVPRWHGNHSAAAKLF
jgi:hypothetical protein